MTRLKEVLFSSKTPRLKNAPRSAQKKKTFEGENLSEIVKKAKLKVPRIKPNCTAEVRFPKASGCSSNLIMRSVITALPANQSEVQQNCEKTITGNIR